MLEAIEANAPREKLMEFPVLQPEDRQVIGFFIQQFNYMDLDLRRAIETFHHAKPPLPELSSAPATLYASDDFGSW